MPRKPKPTPSSTRAAVELLEWLEDQGLKAQDFAADLGIPHSTLSHSMRGSPGRKPRSDTMHAIEKRTGIPMRHWFTKPPQKK